jgi:hypothetical protein
LQQGIQPGGESLGIILHLLGNDIHLQCKNTPIP